MKILFPRQKKTFEPRPRWREFLDVLANKRSDRIITVCLDWKMHFSIIQADTAASDVTWIHDEQVSCNAAVKWSEFRVFRAPDWHCCSTEDFRSVTQKTLSYFSIAAADGKILHWQTDDYQKDIFCFTLTENATKESCVLRVILLFFRGSQQNMLPGVSCEAPRYNI